MGLSCFPPIRVQPTTLAQINLCEFRHTPAHTKRFGSALLLPASAVAKVGKPLAHLSVVRNELAVRFVVLQGTLGIPEVQVAENGEVFVRIMKLGGLCKGSFVTGARFRKLLLAPLHHTEFVVGGG